MSKFLRQRVIRYKIFTFANICIGYERNADSWGRDGKQV